MSEVLYKSIVGITEDYLGPAAPRFIDRQISFHLNKTPKDVDYADIPKLTEWVKVSIALLTEDREMVDDFAKRIGDLASKKAKE
jgi:hypothetical protein